MILSVNEIASLGQALRQAPQPMQFCGLTMISGSVRCDSGFAHHKHCIGQPLRKTTVRIPGPSCIENLCILKMFALFAFFKFCLRLHRPERGSAYHVILQGFADFDEICAVSRDADKQGFILLRVCPGHL